MFFSSISLLATLGCLEEILYVFHIEVCLIGLPIRNKDRLEVALTGLIGFIIFGLLCIRYTRRVIIRKPYIIVQKDGIYDKASVVAAEFISWSEIEEVFIDRDGLIGPRILVIKLKDGTDLVNRVKGVKKLLLKIRENSIYIRKDCVSISIKDLYEIIQTNMIN